MSRLLSPGRDAPFAGAGPLRRSDCISIWEPVKGLRDTGRADTFEADNGVFWWVTIARPPPIPTEVSPLSRLPKSTVTVGTEVGGGRFTDQACDGLSRPGTRLTE